MTELLERLAAQRVLPVIRSATASDAIAAARACARAGMAMVELTRSVPDVDDAVRALGDDGLVVGVGTITEIAEVESAADAGARFVVSFARPPGFVERAAERAIPIAIVNVGETRGDPLAALKVEALAGNVLPRLVAALGTRARNGGPRERRGNAGPPK